MHIILLPTSEYLISWTNNPNNQTSLYCFQWLLAKCLKHEISMIGNNRNGYDMITISDYKMGDDQRAVYPSTWPIPFVFLVEIVERLILLLRFLLVHWLESTWVYLLLGFCYHFEQLLFSTIPFDFGSLPFVNLLTIALKLLLAARDLFLQLFLSRLLLFQLTLERLVLRF